MAPQLNAIIFFLWWILNGNVLPEWNVCFALDQNQNLLPPWDYWASLPVFITLLLRQTCFRAPKKPSHVSISNVLRNNPHICDIWCVGCLSAVCQTNVPGDKLLNSPPPQLLKHSCICVQQNRIRFCCALKPFCGISQRTAQWLRVRRRFMALWCTIKNNSSHRPARARP